MQSGPSSLPRIKALNGQVKAPKPTGQKARSLALAAQLGGSIGGPSPNQPGGGPGIPANSTRSPSVGVPRGIGQRTQFSGGPGTYPGNRPDGSAPPGWRLDQGGVPHRVNGPVFPLNTRGRPVIRK